MGLFLVVFWVLELLKVMLSWCLVVLEILVGVCLFVFGVSWLMLIEFGE